MKIKIHETLQIPEGIECSFAQKKLVCKKDSLEVSRSIDIPGIDVEVKGSILSFIAKKANKKELKKIKSQSAHVRNMFSGLSNKFVYKLEACNVHFPMTLKVDSGFLVINNFLGEKISRKAKILPGVDIEVKGAKITLSSYDMELAGQTAANIEKATKIKNRDRRIFQDGIFITEKPGASK